MSNLSRKCNKCRYEWTEDDDGDWYNYTKETDPVMRLCEDCMARRKAKDDMNSKLLIAMESIQKHLESPQIHESIQDYIEAHKIHNELIKDDY